ncbi:uncharacterized protein LOC116205327 [Punica granatum]|uniref:Uncharacterized protein LOC116205327 n=1 Tax=Punica granatum TaxID=22663 RepID=A0A6P8DPD2_PUNGR|nr:uncharacterized protein LOC116205327 [Punica granatum]
MEHFLLSIFGMSKTFSFVTFSFVFLQVMIGCGSDLGSNIPNKEPFLAYKFNAFVLKLEEKLRKKRGSAVSACEGVLMASIWSASRKIISITQMGYLSSSSHAFGTSNTIISKNR